MSTQPTACKNLSQRQAHVQVKSHLRLKRAARSLTVSDVSQTYYIRPLLTVLGMWPLTLSAALLAAFLGGATSLRLLTTAGEVGAFSPLQQPW